MLPYIAYMDPMRMEYFLFSISYMGCHPNPIDELIFFKMVIAPPTRLSLIHWEQLEKSAFALCEHHKHLHLGLHLVNFDIYIYH